MTDERRTPPMTDEELDRQLRDIYADDGARDPARGRVMDAVLRSTSDTKQRGRARWWRRPRPGATRRGSLSLVPLALAAIVVVVGGLFLISFTDQERELAPAASASVSPSPLVSPSVETTLSRLEPAFTTETVAPGIERVLADGAGLDLGALADGEHVVFEDIDISADGDVWVVARLYDTDEATSDAPFAFELGSEGRYGFEAGFPAFPVKLIAVDGAAVVATSDSVLRYDGQRWIPSAESVSASDFDGTTRFVQPEGVASLGEESVLDPGTDAVLVIHSDGLGYTLGEDVGLHLWREWPSWWEVCGPEPRLEHRGGTGCRSRTEADERGIGVGHANGTVALLMPDVVTRRIARAPDQAVWVIGGPTIDDLRSGRVDESGAIYRIDPGAPGFGCEGC